MDESIRILHVDDDPDYAEMTATFLEQQDAPLEVVTATSTTDALDRLGDDAVDCVISDYDMPNMDGLNFLETVRSDYPELPFILFTGKGSEEIASEAISAGVTDYLQKETGADHYLVLANRVMDAVERVRSEVSYQEVFDKAGIGLTVRDIESGDLIDVNQRYCEMLGYDRDEVLDLTLEELTADVPGYSAERGRAKLREAIDRGSASFEWPDRTKDGETVWVDIDLTRAEIDGRQRLLVSIQDITERKERERDLTKAKRRFESVFNNPVGFMGLLDPDGTLRDANRPALEFIDRDLGEVQGEPFWETPWWTHSSALQAALKGWIERAADGERVEFEAEHLGPDDRSVVIEGALHPVHDEAGTVTSILVAGRDISERKARERDLVRYQQAIDSVGAGVCMLDDSGAFELVNSRLEDLTGYDRATLLDSSISTLMDESTMNEATDLISAPTDEITAFEWQLQTANGDSIPCEARISRVDFDDAPGTIWAVADMSDRMEREGELMRQNDRLERVISIISHDLRNPLSVATGQLELAQADAESEHVDKAASALDRMAEIVDDILTLARTGHRIDPTDSIDLDRVATGCWTNVETGAASLFIESNVAFRADEVHIQNLLENLIRNAVEHGGADVSVRLGKLNEGDGFYVEDDGSGIPDDDRAQVFESGYSSVEGNVGLGLNIVREIADAHGWDITLTEGQEGGARFEFSNVTILS